MRKTMTAALIGLAAALAGLMAAGAQTPMEAVEGATVLESNVTLRTGDGELTFAAGDQDTVRSGIYQAWKYTAVLFRAAGDSTAVTMYVYGGDADRLAGLNQANDATMQFVLMDSLRVDAEGTYIRQISDNMVKCRFFYLEFAGRAGNGHGTCLDRVKALRERY